MSLSSRRSFLASCLSVAALSVSANGLSSHVFAQNTPAPVQNRFKFEDVIKSARDLASSAYNGATPALPNPLQKLDFDAYRDIRFRPERALLNQPSSLFRMQMFHLGFLYQRPVTVNVLNEGLATPVAYQAQLFDYGRTKFEKQLPINLGFAGFRLHYPLNTPKVFDELISFLGASYFRVLGRNQQYGLSARGLTLNAGGAEEEFPYFREFWVETPQANAERVVIYALMDSPSTTAAFQFAVYPSDETVVDVTASLFPRKRIEKIGIAPLTSMFFTGENDRRFYDDFRSELHDSDGLLVHSGTGEWIWRPLRNPKELALSGFVENNPRGFGLMQRDRIFEHYQDLDLSYELRPGYWIEPRDNWGEGYVELIEIPTADETNDNIVAAWIPKQPMEPGQNPVFRYTLKSVMNNDALHPGGRAINTYQAKPKALGSGEALQPGTRRFIVDFAGGDLSYYMKDPDSVQLIPSTSAGRVLRTFLIPNAKTQGFRAGIDIQVEPGQTAHLRAFLKAGEKALTETWTYPWSGN